jgi:hypothetical protein
MKIQRRMVAEVAEKAGLVENQFSGFSLEASFLPGSGISIYYYRK